MGKCKVCGSKHPHMVYSKRCCGVLLDRIAELEAQLAAANGVLDEIGDIMWDGNCESCEKVGIALAKRKGNK